VFFSEHSVYSQKLPYGTSIYTAELLAIRAALQYISKFSIKHLLFLQTLSVLQSLESQKLHQSLILSILTIIHHLHSNNDVVFCWIPSHISIAGNEKADQAAKSALNLPNITSYPLPYSDITSSIKKHLFTRWQHLWHNSTSNKLHNIYPTLPINSNYPKGQLTRHKNKLFIIVFE